MTEGYALLLSYSAYRDITGLRIWSADAICWSTDTHRRSEHKCTNKNVCKSKNLISSTRIVNFTVVDLKPVLWIMNAKMLKMFV